MCYNCGCHNPQDDMGSPDNITSKTFADLAEKISKSEQETKLLVFQNLAGKLNDQATNPLIEEMFQKAAKAWGQSVAEAKKQAFSMLKEELHIS